MWRLVKTSRPDDRVAADDGSEDLRWFDLLAEWGPVYLVSLNESDDEDARLYGPPGARWGQPDVPCPYVDGQLPPGECTLGQGHIGPHVDSDGYPLGQTVVTIADLSAGRITPQEAALTACTCGHPAVHRPGCPRYNRWEHSDAG
jgi:hypothetical protein